MSASTKSRKRRERAKTNEGAKTINEINEPVITRKSRIYAIPFIFFVACILAYVSYLCGMRQFNGYDSTIMIDMAWRIYCGQHACADFPATVPACLYLGAAVAFKVFGVFWSSLVKINCVYIVICTVWISYLLRFLLRDFWLSLMTAVACVGSSLVYMSNWWYNPVTAAATCVYVAAVLAFVQYPDTRWVQASMLLALFAEAFTKPNIAFPMILGGLIVALMKKETRVRFIALSAAAFILLWIVLASFGVSLAGLLTSYLKVGGVRLSSTMRTFMLPNTDGFDKVYIVLQIAAALAVAAYLLVRASKSRQILVFGIIVILTTIDACLLNTDVKATELTFCLLLIVYLGHQTLKDLRWIWMTLGLFTSCFLTGACTRELVSYGGIGTFYEDLLRGPVEMPFLKGMNAGHNLQFAASIMNEVVTKNPNSKIWFGPRLQWAYAAYGLKEKPNDQPVWWEPGLSFALSEEQMYIKRWEDAHYDILVFMDLANINPQMVSYIEHHYHIAYQSPMDQYAGLMHVMVANDSDSN